MSAQLGAHLVRSLFTILVAWRLLQAPLVSGSSLNALDVLLDGLREIIGSASIVGGSAAYIISAYFILGRCAAPTQAGTTS